MTSERTGTVAMLLVASCLGGAVTHLFLGRPVAAQGAAAPVTASQVNLVDGQGTLRAVLAASDERGLTSLAFYDDAGRVRERVGLQPDGAPVLELLGADGAVRLQALVQGDDAVVVAGGAGGRQGLFGAVQGTPMLSLGDGARTRLQIALGATGEPRLVLADASGAESASLVVGSGDEPQLMLSAAGRPRALLTVVQDATLLNLYDETTTRLIVGVAEDGNPSVNFLDDTGAITSSLPLAPMPR